MKVLLVEDDTNTAQTIQALFCAENIVCDITSSGEEAAQINKIYEYDVLIVDLMLPDMSGHELLKEIRNSSISAPVLILSGLQSIQEKVKALGFGADDYMTKPFNTDELIVRVKALARRAEGHPSSIIRVGELQLNLDTQTIEARGIPLELTGKEYQILAFLMLRKGATVTKENFLNRLYTGLDEPEVKIIDVFMCKIRKKLAKVVKGRYIETIWGRGYVLREPTKASLQEHIAAPAAVNNVHPISFETSSKP